MTTFSILSWCFFLIAVVSALVLTTISNPLVRKYRRVLLSLVATGFILGVTTLLMPLLLRKLNPDQSRLILMDQLVLTQWVEPNTNPETSLPEDEIAWTKNVSYRFKYKLTFDFEAARTIAIYDSTFVILDQNGMLHGFDAYSGFNHWSLDLHATTLLGMVQNEKRLYLLDRVHDDSLRVSCLDLQNPSLLWQRLIPNSKEGDLSFDLYSQSIVVSTGVNGIWALKSKTGEILWKRPELYSKSKAIPSPKHLLAFEPMVANKAGSWYFLDPQTGKTLQKHPHVFPEIDRLIPVMSEEGVALSFLVEVQAQHLYSMNQTDLTQSWNLTYPEAIEQIRTVGRDEYMIIGKDHLLEKHKITNNQLLWQKKVTEVSSKWVQVIPAKRLFLMPLEDSSGVMFFNLEQGEYLFTAKTSEPIVDVLSYGDWLYFLSNGHIWAFQHQGTTPGNPSP